MKAYGLLIYLYTSLIARLVRAFIMFVLLLLIVQFFTDSHLLKIPVFLLNIFLMLEIFFHYKIAKAAPTLSVTKNRGTDVYDSFTLDAIYPFITAHDVGGIIKQL